MKQADEKLVEVTERLYDFNGDGIPFLAAKAGDRIAPSEAKRLEKTTKAFREGTDPFSKLQAAAAGERKVKGAKAEADRSIAAAEAARKAEAEAAKAAEEAAATAAAGGPAAGKPVADMTVAELKAHAADKKIDITGLKKADDLRAAIEKAAAAAGTAE